MLSLLGVLIFSLGLLASIALVCAVFESRFVCAAVFIVSSERKLVSATGLHAV